MSIHAKDIIRQNLIGKEVSVVNSPNKNLIRKKGIVVDETKNTLRIKYENKENTLIKDQVSIEICGTRIEGQDIVKEATERIKLR